jgi:hypothetical protein
VSGASCYSYAEAAKIKQKADELVRAHCVVDVAASAAMFVPLLLLTVSAVDVGAADGVGGREV